jgi:hypothetical protein
LDARRNRHTEVGSERDRLEAAARLQCDSNGSVFRQQDESTDGQAAESNRQLDAVVGGPRLEARLLTGEDDSSRLDSRQLRIEGKRLEPTAAQVEHAGQAARGAGDDGVSVRLTLAGPS